MILKASEYSEKKYNFRFNDNNSFPLTVSDSGVFIRLIEIDNWVRVFIEVDENTTSDDIRTAIPIALLWRDKLLELQGIWAQGGFLEELSFKHKFGKSYSYLVNQINKHIESLLQEYENYLKDFEVNKHKFETMFDFYMWQSKFNQFSFMHAKGMLKTLKLKDSEIDELLKIGLENTESGKPAFEKDYPVCREKLISTLKTWRNGKKHQIIEKIHYQNK